MRSDKELLELLLNQVLAGGFKTGLCAVLDWRLYCEDRIDVTEWIQLHKLLSTNRPEETGTIFWWPVGQVEPRIQFLKQLIEKYENS